MDEYGATSSPGIFAAGDVAHRPDPASGGTRRVEHWTHAQEHGAAVARTMLGVNTPYAPVPWYWTRQYDVNLQVCGNPQAAQSMTVSGSIEALDFSAVLQQGDQVVGLVCAGRSADFRRLRPTVTGHAPGDRAVEAAGAWTGDVRPGPAPGAGARPTTGSADFTDSEGSVGSRCSESAGGSEG